MSNIKILIAAHKETPLPHDDIFLPIQAGRKVAKEKLDMQGDDEGDNISERNPNYCELTALYWAWKYLKGVDYIGLCHYRRYFKVENTTLFSKDKHIISFQNLSEVSSNKLEYVELLKQYDIILSKPIIYPNSLHVDYCNHHSSEDYDAMRGVFVEKYPEYVKSFDEVFLNNNKLSPCNMFVTSYPVFNQYSKWIFSVLADIENQLKISEDTYQARVFGFMAERLLLVYVHHHKLKIKYLPVYFIAENPKKKVIII